MKNITNPVRRNFLGLIAATNSVPGLTQTTEIANTTAINLQGIKLISSHLELRKLKLEGIGLVVTGSKFDSDDGVIGLWRWDSRSALDDDDYLVIKPSHQLGLGRWARVTDKVDARWFGAIPNLTSDMTQSLEKAFALAALLGGQLYIAPGLYHTNNLTWQFALEASGRIRLQVVAYGVVFAGISTAPTWRLQRTKGLVIHGLHVSKHSTAPYGAVIDSVWRSQFYATSFEDLLLTATEGWGTYWNEFYSNVIHPSLHFDLTNTSINANQWFGGTVGMITKSPALGKYKEAYGNVFHGVDVLGPPIWLPDTISDPLTFNNCTFEFKGAAQGYLVKRGGNSYAPGEGSSAFPWDCFYGEVDSARGGGSFATGWSPRSSENLLRGGACQSRPQHLLPHGASMADLRSYADPNSPTGNGYCWRLNVIKNGYSSVELRLPDEFMAEAQTVGAVSFSCWLYCASHIPAIIVNTNNKGRGFDQYPSGSSLVLNKWIKRVWTVQIQPTDTQASLRIGGALTQNFDIRIANVAVHLGRSASPYTPCQGEPRARLGRFFRTQRASNGVETKLFEITHLLDTLVNIFFLTMNYMTANGVVILEYKIQIAKNYSNKKWVVSMMPLNHFSSSLEKSSLIDVSFQTLAESIIFSTKTSASTEVNTIAIDMEIEYKQGDGKIGFYE